MRVALREFCLISVFGVAAFCQAQLWPHSPSSSPLSERFQLPAGFQRISQPEHSFGAWLRNLPLKPGNPPVHLFNGQLKDRQDVHCAVVDLDVGNTDLQQCSKAVIRLRAEYLWQEERKKEIRFLLVGGDWMDWPRWEKGERPVERGDRIRWVPKAVEDGSYQNFEKYLRSVFIWANTMSLSRQLEPVADPRKIRPGDVFVKGGFPGHAVIVVDVAEDSKGNRVFLLAQSYMPAQEMHILKNPADISSPWYAADGKGKLETPQWVFGWSQLRRFSEP